MWLLKFNFFAVTIWPLCIYLTMRKQQLLLNVSRLFITLFSFFSYFIWTASFFTLVAHDHAVRSLKRCNNMWFWLSVNGQHKSRWQLYSIFDMWWWNLYFSNSEHLSKMSYTINTFTHRLCVRNGIWMICTTYSSGLLCFIWVHIWRFTQNTYQ